MRVTKGSLINVYTSLKHFFKGYKNIQMVSFKLSENVLEIQAFRGKSSLEFALAVERDELDNDAMLSVQYNNLLDILIGCKEVNIRMTNSSIMFKIDDTTLTSTQKFDCEYIDTKYNIEKKEVLSAGNLLSERVKELSYTRYMKGQISVMLDDNVLKVFQVNSYSELPLGAKTGLTTLLPQELLEAVVDIIPSVNYFIKEDDYTVFIGNDVVFCVDTSGTFNEVIVTEDKYLFEINNAKGLIGIFRKAKVKELNMHSTKDAIIIESVKHDNDVSIEKVIVQDKTVPFSFQVSVEEMFGAMTFLDSGTVKVFTFGHMLLLKGTSKFIVIGKVDNR